MMILLRRMERLPETVMSKTWNWVHRMTTIHHGNRFVFQQTVYIRFQASSDSNDDDGVGPARGMSLSVNLIPGIEFIVFSFDVFNV